MKNLFLVVPSIAIIGIGHVIFYAYRYIWFGITFSADKSMVLFLVTSISIVVAIPSIYVFMDNMDKKN